MRFLPLMLALPAILGGCTHLQLGRSTLLQAGTITDLEYKQVLSNLASYHCNPDCLPHFAVIGTGGTSVSDSGTVTAELEWNAATLARELLGLNASREVQENWTLAPVINPDKLRTIKSVFQLVVLGSAKDPEADKLLRSYLGDDYSRWIEQGWYGVGKRGDVPADACYAAHRGDVYVWVTAEGVEALSRLTIIILDIATLDPAPPPAERTITVEEYKYNSDGTLASIETSTRVDSSQPPAPSSPGQRKDFYNPLQSQIQMQQAGGK